LAKEWISCEDVIVCDIQIEIWIINYKSHNFETQGGGGGGHYFLKKNLSNNKRYNILVVG
jgi:hypothetical protein